MRRTALARPLRLIVIAVMVAAAVGDMKAAEPLPRILKAKGLSLAMFLRFSPDGRFLASYHFPSTAVLGGAAKRVAMHAPADNSLPSVAVWDVAKAKLLWCEEEPHLVAGGFGNCNSHLLDFSSDSSLVAVPSSPMSAMFDWIGLRSVTSGRLQRTCKFEKRGPLFFPVVFSPNGKLLAFSQSPDSIQLWNPKAGTQLAVMRQPYPAMVMDMAFSPDGRTLVTYGPGMNVQARGQGTHAPAMPRGFDAAGTGAFVLDFWDTSTRKLRHSQKVEQRVMEVGFSPDGKLLTASGGESSIVFDVATGELRHTIKALGGKLAFSGDGRSITVAWCSGNQLRVSIADLASDRSKITIEQVFDESVMLKPVLSANGQLLVTVADASVPSVLVYDTQSGRQRVAYRPAAKGSQSYYSPIGITGALSPDDRTFAAARIEGAIELWPIPATSPRDKQAATENPKE